VSEEPASPCRGVCRLDEEGRLCLGCLRTLDEIAAWSGADATTKREILARVAERVQNAATYASKPTDGGAGQG